MLPAVVAEELQDAVKGFLRSAFPITTSYFQQGKEPADTHRLIDDLIERPGAIFKGPYLNLKLPFRRAEGEPLPFRHLALGFTPYLHQQRAFLRLTGDATQPTLVATGTGSGKTECFMMPVLEACLANRQRGIKALVIYPMNALATDQAKRFAEEVHKLDTRLTVGLFVGGEQKQADQTMGPNNVITDHDTLRKNPPDILLTNYKMLDFLLIRPKDQPLWKHNNPGVLRYLVVDELHTFDGAQGTDLACLIRRLRDRLQAGDELACVGTSATLGTGEGCGTHLLNYASEVFACKFLPDSLIGEDRLTAQEYLREADGQTTNVRYFNWPLHQTADLSAASYTDVDDYLFHQTRLWFSERSVGELPALNAPRADQRQQAAAALGQLLRGHVAFHELVYASEQLTDGNELAASWQQRLHLPRIEEARALLTSLLSLVSTARLELPASTSASPQYRPFLQVNAQLWLRELRRMVCSLPSAGEVPQLQFADDLQDSTNPLHLPLLHCRECNLAGWGALAKGDASHLEGDLKHFYRAWFGHEAQARVMVPLTPDEAQVGQSQAFCSQCGRLQIWRGKGCCDCENASLIPVWLPNITHDTSRGVQSLHHCPGCGSRNGLMILGYRAATLTSVMVGRLFATPYNDDYKLIAFSDSVQDAAHRAGFLGANTWRQVMRQAMVWWLKQQSRPLSLADMAELLPAFWRQLLEEDALFCGVFIPPELNWKSDYDKLCSSGRLPANSYLPELIERRLSWECVAEFGHRSQLGRSLERSGQAALQFDVAALAANLAPLAARLREQTEALRQLSDTALVGFVVGWLHHLRHIGAIYHQALSGYLSNKGNDYLLNKLEWMPNFGGGKRPPAAISLEPVATNFEAIMRAKQESWSIHWLKKTLGGDHVMVSAEAQQVYHLLLGHLTKHGWLVEKTCGQHSVYLLNPSHLRVSVDVWQAECSHCHHRFSMGSELAPAYDGLACLRSRCVGHLAVRGRLKRSRDYGLSMPRRLVPGEHTGLLEREARLAVEHSFIEGQKPWDVNLLSATPTLEMGIDIGALSSVFLCSVPPAQSNYLQRIGRAGRRDGNALAVTLANGRNHDLYFYAEPLEMMAGNVQTPGVFLQARAVLERQLVAYCLGRWVTTHGEVAQLPGKMRQLVDLIEKPQPGRFPYNFIAYVSEQSHELLTDFWRLFVTLDDEAKRYLTVQLVGEGGTDASRSLGVRLVERLQEIVDERSDLVRQVRQLKSAWQRLETLPDDEATREEIAAVKREREALQALLYQMNNQLVLNFLTDEGILPNYAFPEEGVTLQSVILRRRSKEQAEANEKPYTKMSYSFQRPAQAALSELAPDSRFYAISHELPIDRVDLQRSRVESWRFCDRCQYHQQVDLQKGDRDSACPRCGSPQWADKGQKQSVLRLRQVYSTVDDAKSRIGDDAEQRQPAFFNRQMLVDIPPGSQTQSVKLNSDALPFGFEFLPRATFREVNFGTTEETGQTFAVAGDKQPRAGFHLCKHCGTVQKEQRRAGDKQHAYNCRLRQKPDSATENDFYHSLYLYRELESEAIRVLLPLSEVAYSDEGLHSFIAALNLGLREYFHGDVHHLQVTDMREPSNAQSGERVYLVVYDSIPGGTGYLKELMAAPANLMQVLACAHKRLSHCDCVDDPLKDGCYRCILAYRDSRNMASISRRHAADLLADILALSDNLQAVEGLSSISTNSLIESKLEQRFVEALAALPTARLSKQLVNGKSGSLLTLDGADGHPVGWQLEHQVMAGPGDGVALETRIDVLLTPARAEDAKRYKPIAIYVDGLQYHHDRVDDDVRKRMALLLSGRYHVFSLNWDDLPQAGEASAECNPDLMVMPASSEVAMKQLYGKIAKQAGWLELAECASQLKQGSFRWLDNILREPAILHSDLPQMACYRGLTCLVPQASPPLAVLQKFDYELIENAPTPVQDAWHAERGNIILGGFIHALGNSPGRVELAAGLPLPATREGTASALAQGLLLHLCFDDRDTAPTDTFKAAWRAFWKAANILQFLPGFSMATRCAVADTSLTALWETAQHIKAETAETAATDIDVAWQEVLELSALPVKSLHALMALGVAAPLVGEDLVDDGGQVVIGGDEAELSWPKLQLAVVNKASGLDKTRLPGWTLVGATGDWLAEITRIQGERAL